MSTVTGEEEAAPATGVTFKPNEENMRRWNDWWSAANKEQFSPLRDRHALDRRLLDVAYSTVFGQDIGEDLDSIQGEATRSRKASQLGSAAVRRWVALCKLFAASIGIADSSHGSLPMLSRSVPARLEDVVGVAHLHASSGPASSSARDPVAGFDQPLVLTVLAASLSGVVMFIYSGL